MSRIIKVSFALFDYFNNAAVFDIAFVRFSYSSTCKYDARSLFGYFHHYSGRRVISFMFFNYQVKGRD